MLSRLGSYPRQETSVAYQRPARRVLNDYTPLTQVASLCFWAAAKGHLPVAQYRGSKAAIHFCENWAELVGILLFAFQCENYPIFQHGAKEHDFDMFWSCSPPHAFRLAS